MNINRDNRESVAIGPVPAMAQRHTNIATTVALPIVGHHPLKAKVLALGKHVIGTLNSNREAHEKQKKERWRGNSGVRQSTVAARWCGSSLGERQ
jgi:hypothetical protein